MALALLGATINPIYAVNNSQTKQQAATHATVQLVEDPQPEATQLVNASKVMDFNGDGLTDYVVTRFTGPNITWYISLTNGSTVIRSFGLPGDIAVPEDYDGDGWWDIAVWRPGAQAYFYVLSSQTGAFLTPIPWGKSGDNPTVTQHFDSDAKADPTVVRSTGSTLTWYILQTLTGTLRTVTFGQDTTDLTRRGDYDGDGKADIAVYRGNNGTPANTFFVLRSSDGQVQVQQFGQQLDYKAPADFDGDHKTDYAVYRPSNGTWYWIESSTGFPRSKNFGASLDLPVPGDYDGDGKTDHAVWRPGQNIGDQSVFYISGSTAGSFAFPWGVNGDQNVTFGLQIN